MLSWIKLEVAAHKVRSVLILIAAGLLIFLWAGSLTDSYRDCERSAETYYSDYDNPGLFELAHTFFTCEGAAGDANGELLTALATIAVAAFTLTLWLTGAEQARLTRESIDLARNEFNATHRPRIIVHFVKYQTFSVGSEPDARKIGADLVFFNVGDIEANVIRVEWTNTRRRERPLKSGIPLRRREDISQTIKSGGQGVKFLESDFLAEGEAQIQRAETARKNVGNITYAMGDEVIVSHHLSDIYLIGKVAYDDMGGTRRETGFCCRLDAVGERWVREENSEYEYAY